ncbi:hypothetical protein BGP_6118 [Beggiatoa sp. PS]|nr:hypothetical protein BGP_6118 [Beggiatoa sp. PS]
MIYFDTSFVIPKYIAEATSEKVEAVLLSLSSLNLNNWKMRLSN